MSQCLRCGQPLPVGVTGLCGPKCQGGRTLVHREGRVVGSIRPAKDHLRELVIDREAFLRDTPPNDDQA